MIKSSVSPLQDILLHKTLQKETFFNSSNLLYIRKELQT